MSVCLSVFLSVCMSPFFENFAYKESKGVKMSQKESKGVKRSREESRGVKRSKEEPRRVKKSQEGSRGKGGQRKSRER